MRKIRRFRFGFPLMVLALTFSACSGNDEEIVESSEWELTWSDEFNLPTLNNLPNPAKWGFEQGATGSGNQELQNYTNREENCAYTTHAGEGCLRITALNDNYQGIAFSSARIRTKKLFEQQYGRFEARIKLPYGPGIWPAFWLLGNDYDTVGWPECGEIDIMENKGWQPNVVSSALHFPGRSGGNPITQTFEYNDRRFDTDFHIFACEWSEGQIDFFVDNHRYKRVKHEEAKENTWAFDHPFFVILNVAVGGTFVGNPTDETKFPQSMYVDYVRVYQRSATFNPDNVNGDTSTNTTIDQWNGDGIDSDKGDTGVK